MKIREREKKRERERETQNLISVKIMKKILIV